MRGKRKATSPAGCFHVGPDGIRLQTAVIFLWDSGACDSDYANSELLGMRAQAREVKITTIRIVCKITTACSLRWN